MKYNKVLGIDVGGSGIKAAPIDVKSGRLLAERYRIPTPKPATPKAVEEVVLNLVQHFHWQGAVGIGFPSTVQNGVVKTAVNIDKSWININALDLFAKALRLPAFVVNDADAAGLAEMRFGAGRKVKGITLLLTIGTGVGSALFVNGELVPNSELGQIYMQNGLMAEKYVADSLRQQEGLEWTQWGTRFNEYLLELEKIFSPELFIIGGGVSKRADKFMHSINISSKIVMAEQRNEAGLIGAALAANKMVLKKK